MRSTISTWEDALAELISKKSKFYRPHAPRSSEPRQPDAANHVTEIANRGKAIDQYIMLVETDVASDVHSILSALS